jgi:alpha-beta hydrolase superfamily lysophospholipase
MEDHACNVWEEYIHKPGHSQVFVVAHSAGGACLNSIIKKFGSRALS